MREISLLLRVIIFDADKLSRQVLEAILKTKSVVSEVRFASTIADANKALQEGFNCLFIDIFSLESTHNQRGDVRIGLNFIGHTREAYPIVSIGLYSKSKLLLEMPGVDDYWRNRFRHYFKLAKDTPPEEIEKGAKGVLDGFAYDIERESARRIIKQLSEISQTNTNDIKQQEKFAGLVESAKNFSQQIYRKKLRENIVTYFSELDLQNLCFDLGVDYESLPAQGKEGKVREVILFFEKHERLQELFDYCKDARPKANWEVAKLS